MLKNFEGYLADLECIAAQRMASSWPDRFPLHAAACKVEADTLRALLAARPGATSGINDLDDEGRAPLHYAAWNGLLATTEALLAANAAVDVRSGDRRSTPLHFAAGMGHLNCVESLLRHGADVFLVDIDRWTPLDIAKQDLMKSPHCTAIVALLQSAQKQERT